MRRSYGLIRRPGSPRRRNLCRQKHHSEPSPAHFVHFADLALQIGGHLPIRLPAIVQTFREIGQRGAGANSTRFALTHPAKSSTCSPRFSREQRVLDLPSLSAAPRSAAHRAIEASKAEADATCEHQRNRAGEAVLPGLNLGAADSRLNFGYLMC